MDGVSKTPNTKQSFFNKIALIPATTRDSTPEYLATLKWLSSPAPIEQCKITEVDKKVGSLRDKTQLLTGFQIAAGLKPLPSGGVPSALKKTLILKWVSALASLGEGRGGPNDGPSKCGEEGLWG